MIGDYGLTNGGKPFLPHHSSGIYMGLMRFRASPQRAMEFSRCSIRVELFFIGDYLLKRALDHIGPIRFMASPQAAMYSRIRCFQLLFFIVSYLLDRVAGTYRARRLVISP